jgi:glutamate synthase domain-containing protein 3
VLFVLEDEDILARRINRDWVVLEPGISAEEEAWVREIIVDHARATKSQRASELLHQWGSTRLSLNRVIPLGSVRWNISPLRVMREA